MPSCRASNRVARFHDLPHATPTYFHTYLHSTVVYCRSSTFWTRHELSGLILLHPHQSAGLPGSHSHRLGGHDVPVSHICHSCLRGPFLVDPCRWNSNFVGSNLEILVLIGKCGKFEFFFGVLEFSNGFFGVLNISNGFLLKSSILKPKQAN